MKDQATQPMNLSRQERILVGMLRDRGQRATLITRKSDKPFDLAIEGETGYGDQKCKFSGWLPLSCIHELTSWTSNEIAGMSDYSMMVREGDWSGIRDSSPESIWAIFEAHVLPLTTTVLPENTVYSVKNVKSFQGREGYGFECSLYRDGKKIGTVTDTANGGCYDFYLKGNEDTLLNLYCLQLQAEAIEEDAEQWEKDLYPLGRFIDPETLVGRLVSEYENTQRLRRKCRTLTLFTLHSDDAPNNMWVIGMKCDDKMRKHLKDKHGDNLKEIINDRFTK